MGKGRPNRGVRWAAGAAAGGIAAAIVLHAALAPMAEEPMAGEPARAASGSGLPHGTGDGRSTAAAVLPQD